MSWLGNSFRSFKYALPEIAGQQFGNILNIAKSFDFRDGSNNREVARDAITDTKNWIKEPGLPQEAWGNLSHQLKTGNLYKNTSDSIDLGGDLDLGDGFDMDAILSGTAGMDDDFGDDDSSESVNVIQKDGRTFANVTQNRVVNNQIIQSQTGRPGLDGIIASNASFRSSKVVASAVVRAAEAQGAMLEEIRGTIANFHYESARYSAQINGVLVAVGDQIEAVKSELEKMNARYEQKTPGFGDDSKSASDVFKSEGEFDFAAYVEVMREKLVADDGLKMIMADVAKAPINFVFDTAGQKVVSTKLFESFTSLNETMGTLPHLMFLKLNEWKESENKVVRGLAKFFGVDDNFENEVNLGSYHRGAIPFDGETKKAITDVIPSYLSKMLNALEGGKDGDRQIYDDRTGKFTTKQELLDEFKQDKENVVKRSFFDQADALVGSREFKNEEEKDKFRSQILSVYKGLAEKGVTYKGGTIDSEHEEAARLVQENFESGDTAHKAKFNSGMVEYRSDMTRFMEDAAGQGTAVRTALMDQDLKAGGSAQKAVVPSPHEGKYNFAKPGTGVSVGIGEAKSETSHHAELFDRIGDEPLMEGESITLKDIMKAPIRITSKVADKINDKIGAFFFGGEDGKPGRVKNFFTRMDTAVNRVFFGEDGIKEDASFADNAKAALNKAFVEPMKKFFMGDGEEKLGVFGHVRTFMDDRILKPLNTKWNEAVNAFNSAVLEPVKDWFNKEGGFIDKFKTSFLDTSDRVRAYFIGTKGEDGEVSKDGVFSKVQNWMDEKVFAPTRKFFMGEKGEDGNEIHKGVFTKMDDWFQEKVFAPTKTFLMGDKNKEGKYEGGMLSHTLNSFTEKLFNPTKKYLFGNTDEEGNNDRTGLFARATDKLNEKIFAPVKTYLLGDGKEGGDKGLLVKVKDDIVANAINPMKKYLFGNKDEEGKNDRSGLFLRMSDKISETIGNPMRDWFNGKTGGDAGTFRESVKNWFDTKLMNPAKNFLFGSEDKPGIFKKIETGLNEKVFAPAKKYLFGDGSGKDGGGLFGKVKGGISDFFYGNEEKGTQGFVNRVLKPAGDYVNEQLVEPFKKTVAESWAKAKDFFADQIITPLKGTLTPFTEELRHQFNIFKEWSADGLRDAFTKGSAMFNSGVKDTLGIDLGEMLKTNVLDPIKGALESVKNGLGKALGALLKFPVNVVRGVSDDLKIAQLREGRGGHISAEERKRLGAKAGIKDWGPQKLRPGAKVAKGEADFAKTAKKAETDAERGKRSANQAISANNERPLVAESTADEHGISKGSGSSKGASAAEKNQKAGRDATSAATGKKSGAAAAGKSTESSPGSKDKSSLNSVLSGGWGKSSEDKESSASFSSAAQSAAIVGTERNTDKMLNFMKKHMSGVGNNIYKIAKKLGATKGRLGSRNLDGGAPQSLLGKVTSIITSPVKFLSNLAGNVLKAAGNVVTEVAKGAVEVVKAPFRLLGGIARSIGKAASTALDVVSSVAKGIGPVLKGLGSALGDATKALGSVAGNILKAGGRLVDGIAKGLAPAITAVGKGLAGLVKGLAPAISGLAKLAAGLVKTTADLAAFVLKGIGSGLQKAAGVFRRGKDGEGEGGRKGRRSDNHYLRRIAIATEITAGIRKRPTAIAGAMFAKRGAPAMDPGHIAPRDTLLGRAGMGAMAGLKGVGQFYKAVYWDAPKAALGYGMDKAGSAKAQLKARGEKLKEKATNMYRQKSLQAAEGSRMVLGKMHKGFSSFFPMLISGLMALGPMLMSGFSTVATALGGAKIAKMLSGKGFGKMLGKIPGLKKVPGLGKILGLGGALGGASMFGDGDEMDFDMPDMSRPKGTPPRAGQRLGIEKTKSKPGLIKRGLEWLKKKLPSKFGKALNPGKIMGVFKKMGPKGFLKLAGRFAGPLALAATAGMAGYGGAKAWMDAEELSGWDAELHEPLSTMDKARFAVGGALSNVAFDLIPASTIAKVLGFKLRPKKQQATAELSGVDITKGADAAVSYNSTSMTRVNQEIAGLTGSAARTDTLQARLQQASTSGKQEALKKDEKREKVFVQMVGLLGEIAMNTGTIAAKDMVVRVEQPKQTQASKPAPVKVAKAKPSPFNGTAADAEFAERTRRPSRALVERIASGA